MLNLTLVQKPCLISKCRPFEMYITRSKKNLTYNLVQVSESCTSGLTRAGCGYPHLRGGCGNPHCFVCGAGAAWTCCGGRAQVELAAGAGRARDEKFFVRVNECWAKVHELNQLKNRKTRESQNTTCRAGTGAHQGVHVCWEDSGDSHPSVVRPLRYKREHCSPLNGWRE